MTASRPQFSIVAAVYNVKPYLDQFIASVERQQIEPGRLEVVLVDDGSTDGSRAVIDAWATRRPELVRVVGKPNGGQASARNLGLEHVTGEWVTFSDPDDMLHPAFFARAVTFLDTHPDIELLAARPVVLDEQTGERHPHARARQYEGGTRVVDLRADPNVFPGGTNISVFRTDRIRSTGLRFDEQLKPVFEDVHFTASYILGMPAPVVGMVTGMRYVYRKRAANDSTLQRGWSDAGRFTTVLERGHLDLLRRSGDAPWVQCLAIYDLSWYLWEDERTGNRMRMSPEVRMRFLELFKEILGHLDPEVVRLYRVRPLKHRWRAVLAQGRGGGDWSSDTVAITKLDPQMRLQRAVLPYRGRVPDVRYLRDGKPVEPAWSKSTAVVYFGVTWHLEHTSWIPTGRRITAVVDDVPTRIGVRAGARTEAHRPSLRAGARLIRSRLRGEKLEGKRAEWAEDVGQRPQVFLAHTPLYRRYRDAWVLMDRAEDGGDNAERLFEHLRRERPEVNAYFTLDQGSPGWERLRPVYGSRVVPRGSFQWLMLMLNAAWLVTSHADEDVMQPPDVIEATVRRSYKVAFLQHGVTQQDISRWLNRRDFEFAAVTTDPELRIDGRRRHGVPVHRQGGPADRDAALRPPPRPRAGDATGGAPARPRRPDVAQVAAREQAEPGPQSPARRRDLGLRVPRALAGDPALGARSRRQSRTAASSWASCPIPTSPGRCRPSTCPRASARTRSRPTTPRRSTPGWR